MFTLRPCKNEIVQGKIKKRLRFTDKTVEIVLEGLIRLCYIYFDSIFSKLKNYFFEKLSLYERTKKKQALDKPASRTTLLTLGGSY